MQCAVVDIGAPLKPTHQSRGPSCTAKRKLSTISTANVTPHNAGEKGAKMVAISCPADSG